MLAHLPIFSKESTMRVEDFMAISLTCCAPEETVHNAVHAMVKNHVGAILVTINGTLVGIFTERDLMTRVIGKNLDIKTTPIVSVMTPQPETVREHDEIISVLRRLLAATFRHFPVVRGNKPVGMLSLNTPRLADLLIVFEQSVGVNASKQTMERIIEQDFEDELLHYTLDQFGTKVFKEYRMNNRLDDLKNKVRAEFRRVFAEKYRLLAEPRQR